MISMIVGAVLVILLVFLIAKRIDDKSKENFEQRDN